MVLSGGVAANVKLNQRIAELEGVRRVFIYPNMGDGGTDVGAVLALLCARGEVESKEWETCYLGPDFTEERMVEAIRAAGLQPSRSENVARDVAKLLADGNVVARFAGAMEYGPRALGNRSILYAATDSDVNEWLNRRLGRTEFMPFAPVTLFEHRRDAMSNRQGARPGALHDDHLRVHGAHEEGIAGRSPRGRNRQAAGPSA